MNIAELHARLDRFEEQLEYEMNRERADAQRRMDTLRLLKASVNATRVTLAMNREPAPVQPPAYDEAAKFGGSL